ncbi:MAG: penicillin acylase family protein, partial [Candidatus Kryptoniota bacterium]
QFQEKTDTVYVKGGGYILIHQRSTVDGPVISNVIGSSYALTSVGKQPENLDAVVSMKWTAYYPSDEVKAIHLLSISRTFHDFINALQYFGAPAQNFVYADVRGNIGYKAAGNIPLRNYPHPYLPQDGSIGKYTWSTFIPYDDLPMSYNPDSGFIATANNKTVNNYPYYITNLYEPSSRIERISSFIKTHRPMSMELCRELQNDYYSPFFVSLNTRLLNACDSLKYFPGELVYLRNFDGFIGAKSTAASILNVFFVKLLNDVFVPVMGEDLYKKYSLLSNIPTRVIEKIINDPSRLSTLYNVQNGDSLLSIKMVNSLRESLKFLKDRFGPHPSRWQWGRLHQLELKHFLSKNQLMRRLYDLGPFERGGTNTTVNNGEYSLTNPFGMIIGPSMRMIVVMNQQGMYVNFPGGESGQLLSPHYRDLLHDYLRGEVKYFPFDLNEYQAENKLQLVPGK